jgi:hypothetical protein
MTGLASLSQRARLVLDNRLVVHAVAFAALAFFALATVLEHGAWQRTDTFRGPFLLEDKASRMAIVAIGRDVPLQPILSPRGDSPTWGQRSDLRLRVNGEDWGKVRDAPPSRFAHWFSHLHVALPGALRNDAATILEADYSVRLHPLLYRLR